MIYTRDGSSTLRLQIYPAAVCISIPPRFHGPSSRFSFGAGGGQGLWFGQSDLSPQTLTAQNMGALGHCRKSLDFLRQLLSAYLPRSGTFAARGYSEYSLRKQHLQFRSPQHSLIMKWLQFSDHENDIGIRRLLAGIEWKPI